MRSPLALGCPVFPLLKSAHIELLLKLCQTTLGSIESVSVSEAALLIPWSVHLFFYKFHIILEDATVQNTLTLNGRTPHFTLPFQDCFGYSGVFPYEYCNKPIYAYRKFY